MKKIIWLIVVVTTYLFGCTERPKKTTDVLIPKTILNKEQQDSIIEVYYNNGAARYSYLSKEYQNWLDKGLQVDSTIAIMWKHKAMPYWKIRKYEVALKYFDKAVKYDRKGALLRRGYLKCAYMKSYQSALEDIMAYEAEYGKTYENDHSTTFYKALCFVALNRFQEAKEALLPEVESDMQTRGEDWGHFLDYFYLGIIHYELDELEIAIEWLDKSLVQYNQFSDAKYWKARCLAGLDRMEEAQQIVIEGKKDYLKGLTFNEDVSIYFENFPYQITWEWSTI